jgi:uncharacterized RDD family membrane protein YckC
VEEIVTGEAVVLDLPCARFPTRMLAHLIDMVVQVVAFIVIGTLIGLSGPYLNDASASALAISGYVVVIVGYPTIFETLSRGRTLGKLALGLRVVSDDGGPERFRQALVRGLAGAIESWALIGVPALITSMLSARGKRLGDVFAGTFVVRERAPRQAFGLSADPALAPWASTLDLSALPEQLAVAAGSYLARYYQLHPQARDQLGWQLASSVASCVSPPPPPGVPPYAYLAAVLAERHARELARLRRPAPAPWPAPPPASWPAQPASTSPPAAPASWPAPAFPAPASPPAPASWPMHAATAPPPSQATPGAMDPSEPWVPGSNQATVDAEAPSRPPATAVPPSSEPSGFTPPE